MADNPVQNLLTKIKGAASGAQQLTPTNPKAAMPAARRPQMPGQVQPRQPLPQMKNAAAIYGGGSLLLYGLSFYNLASAEWFNGLVLMVPSTCLAYLAYRYTIQSE